MIVAASSRSTATGAAAVTWAIVNPDFKPESDDDKYCGPLTRQVRERALAVCFIRGANEQYQWA